MDERPSDSPVRQVWVIANPISGIRGREHDLDTFTEALGAAGVEAVVTRTEGAGHATELAREAGAAGPDVVVAVGGDGTVNEVLNGLPDGAGPALATLPTGTSNLMARELDLPFGPVQAAGLLVRGRRRRLDVGRANGRRFLMVVGVGWDAHVVNAVAGARRGHLGMHRYVKPVVETVFDYRFPTLEVVTDGEARPKPVSLAFACNIRNYAAWFALTPDAAPDDGLLDFLLIEGGSPRDYLRWAIAAFLGTLPRYREVEYRQGRRLLVTSDRPVPYQVDGDPGGTTPLEIEIEAGSLEVIVP